MRAVAASFAALLLPLCASACGSDDKGDHDVATDPVVSSATSAPSSSPTSSPTSGPTSSPTVGSYPEFEPADYTFELTVQCFCAGAGTPIEVTVVNSEAAGAVYGTTQGGGRDGSVQAGDPTDPLFRLSINDIIARANDTTAARVKVDWPAGQDYPNSVFVDGSKQIADDEIGYTIANVQVS
jgi:hypothetical protein